MIKYAIVEFIPHSGGEDMEMTAFVCEEDYTDIKNAERARLRWLAGTEIDPQNLQVIQYSV